MAYTSVLTFACQYYATEFACEKNSGLNYIDWKINV